MSMLAAKWLRELNRSWKSERPLVFFHVVITKKLGVCRARCIRTSITSRMDHCERGLHVGLVGGAES